jgi:hypothetical protein
MADVLVVSTAEALYGSHAFRHNFQLFVTQACAPSTKFLVLFESLDRYSLLVSGIFLNHGSALNSPKFLGFSKPKMERIEVRRS